MFNDPGRKIKLVASALFWIHGVVGTLSLLASFVVAITTYGNTVEQPSPLIYILFILLMLLLLALMWIICWIIYLLLYGYGEMIAKTADNEKSIQNCNDKLDTITQIMNEPKPVAKRDFNFNID